MPKKNQIPLTEVTLVLRKRFSSSGTLTIFILKPKDFSQEHNPNIFTECEFDHQVFKPSKK